MKAGLLSLVACLACCVAGLAVSPVVALGEGSSVGLSSAEGSSSLSRVLVTPGSPVEGEQGQAAEEAKLANPNAVAEREASRTKFENLNTEQAARLASEAFPRLIEEPAGGLPKLPAGASITAYPTDNAAQVNLGEGKRGVIESMAPIAIEVSPGRRTPVDLGLGEANAVFEPKTPVVGLRIPKLVSSGVTLGETGVSVTPVDAQGSTVGGSEGRLDGAVVLYANTQTDTDTVVKPTTFGFDADTLLRSVESPEHLYFRLGLPKGASLEQAQDGSGLVRVVDEGAVLATVLPPSAWDAAGTFVPVSMSVSGNTLALYVDDHSGEYQWPIAVDPGFHTNKDSSLTGYGSSTNWLFCTSHATKCEHKEGNVQTEGQFKSRGWGENGYLINEATGEYKNPERAELIYQTQGESHIREFTYNTEESNNEGDNLESSAVIENESKVAETAKLLSLSKNASEANTIAASSESAEGYHNAAAYVQVDPTGSPGYKFTDTLKSATVDIWQPEETKPVITMDTTDEYLNGGKWLNVLDGPNKWMGPNQGAVGFTVEEKGIGVEQMWASHNSGEFIFEQNLLKEGKCKGLQCPEKVTTAFTYSSAKPLPNGRDTILMAAASSIGSDTVQEPTIEVNVDTEKPYGLNVTGLPANGVINEAEYHLRAEAIDGKAPTPSSGIKSLVLAVDGYVLPGKAGSCTPGPCAAAGEWTLNGEGLGAGKHTLTLQAIDNAGNEEKRTYSFTVRHASPVSVGPGTVDPITGALHLSANDVSIGGGLGSLGVSRSYDSRQLTAGEQGPLGPQWRIGISGSDSIEEESTGSVVLVASDGGRTTFESNGAGGYISPKGDENLVLEAEKEGETIKAYLLKDPAAGTTVKYTQVGTGGPWVISSSEGALSKSNGEKETIEWEWLEGVTRPKLALAPASAGVTCSPSVKEPKELAEGCRALSFTYATETTATGEAPGQWKAYKGRLMTVSFTALNPATGKMETKPVAEYAYDKQGRLRAEWDPRIEPSPLKTTYGYDTEGHVTSVNPPGQEPWLLHYGTTASDSTAGRLLAVTRLPAGTSSQVKEEDEQSAPVNSVVPTLSSTSPVIGTTLKISANGTWSNSPLAYSYAWEDCYTYESKEACTPIAGAVNQTYTPQARDAGYTLRGQVTAVNADGATVAVSAASNPLAGVAPAYLRKFGEKGAGEKGQFNAPAGVAIDASGNVWVADRNNNRVQEWSATGTWLHTYGSQGSGSLQFEGPEGIAIVTNAASPSFGDVYVADKGNNRIEELNSEGKYVRAFGSKGSESGKLSSPVGVTVAPNGNVWVADYANNRVDEYTETGSYLGSFGSEGSGEGQFKGPTAIAFSDEDAYVVDSGNDRVEKFSQSGQYIAKFGAKGTGNGQLETPAGIATESVSGDLYVADSANNRIEEFNPAGTFLLAYGKKGEGNGEFSTPQAATVNPAGDVYVSEAGNNRVQELEPKYSKNNPLSEPPALGTSFVTTIDYDVPLWGEGAPDTSAKTEAEEKSEREKWGQTIEENIP